MPSLPLLLVAGYCANRRNLLLAAALALFLAVRTDALLHGFEDGFHAGIARQDASTAVSVTAIVSVPTMLASGVVMGVATSVPRNGVIAKRRPPSATAATARPAAGNQFVMPSASASCMPQMASRT